MYKIISNNKLTLNECSTLDEAMSFAKLTNTFVTIQGPDFEVCGVFGVDEVRDPNYDGWISHKKR